MPQMLFPDPRFRSPTAEGGLAGFGLTLACQAVTDAMSRLSNLLDQAKAAGLLITHWFSANEGHPTAVSAQATYDAINNGNLVIESDDACTATAAQANAAADELQALLASKNTSDPNYTPPAQNPYTPDSGSTLDKLKPLFIAGAVAIGAIALLPLLFEVAGVSRMLRTSKKRYAAYRRKR